MSTKVYKMTSTVNNYSKVFQCTENKASKSMKMFPHLSNTFNMFISITKYANYRNLCKYISTSFDHVKVCPTPFLTDPV